MLCVLKSKSTSLSLALASMTILSSAGVQNAVAQTCVPSPSGVVSRWGADGDATDLVGGNDGTLTNGTTFAPGFVGDAFSFDGLDDVVSISRAANLSMTSAYSLEAWVLNTGPSSLYRIVAVRGDTIGNDFEVYIQAPWYGT